MPEIPSDVVQTRRFLKERLQRHLPMHPSRLSEWSTISDLLKRTVLQGESNSVLLIGPRGTGKTTLISSVLCSLLSEENFCKNTFIVHLNGLIHTDDRIALKSATVQLKLENAVDRKVFGSFAENLAFLLACLKSGNKKSKSIIFILEEFDLFCSHHNQTLLYNLFDVSQSAQAPICVLGITCRLDVIELLEKRVKSRFSHRQIFLFPESNQFLERLKQFKELLQLPTEKDLNTLGSLKPHPKYIDTYDLPLLKHLFDPKKYKFSKKHLTDWNKHIDVLVEDQIVKSSLQHLYDYDVTDAFFKKILFKLVSQLKEEQKYITAANISQIVTQFNQDDKVLLLCGLSVLELCLVISIKHHSEIYDRDPFNFEIIFTRFQKFAKTSTTMHGVERSVVLKAFEHLKNLEFIVPLSGSAGNVQKEFQMHRLLLTNGQINQAVNKYQSLPTEVSQWALSSLI